jgi:dimethylhistidine N-methyltransferase
MMSSTAALRLNDEAHDEAFLSEAITGLQNEHKELPCKYFYDERGSQLFDQICELPEYYPTRTERSIMRAGVDEMAIAIGPDALLVEYGSGSSLKTRLLLDVLERPAAYVPVDISRDHLLKSAESLAQDYPGLPVLPVCADFTQPFRIPETEREPRRRVVYFPGSTIGNFTRDRATSLLKGVAEVCGPGGALLIGVDLKKDRQTLERAYDDSQGVTAAFNRNMLVRMNRELDADFDVDRFQHRAVWKEDVGRVEMHLVSEIEQTVEIDGEEIHFAEGEHICTEHSHKYTLEDFAEMGASAAFRVDHVWTDPAARFSVQLLERTP